MVVYPTSLDLLIEGRAYINGSLMEVSIGIVGGKIAWIGKYSKAPPAAQVVHLQSKEILLPGMVDMHVHMRDLEEASKEDWYTGTLSALAGGVTFVADMPNNKPSA
ncbi:MAG TPA: dihydroorotase, partial [Thermofilaceae archaeon]|nr:dihydroorotase [Thermofilaceae archaeon]